MVELEMPRLEAPDLVGAVIENPNKYVKYLDVNALIQRNETAGRRFFNAKKESEQLDALLGGLPKSNEVWKIVSGRDGFSCISLIDYICRSEPVSEMWMTSFRCAVEQMKMLESLHEAGLLGYVCVIVSKMASRERGYFKSCAEICARYGWDFDWAENHSKVTLLKTAENFYIFETSANLNNNPRIEQYSLENSEDLYEFYLPLIKGLRDYERVT